MSKLRRKIIYVDDVNYSLVSLKDRLKSSYDIYPAQSVEKMFEILELVAADLILMDVNMPDTNGYEAIKLLKEDARYSRIPVIFLTSKSDRESIIEGMKLGAVDYMTKPYTDAKLTECIELHLCYVKKEADRPIILVVDDNPSILKAINYLLHDKYIVRTLLNPERIKDLLQRITPDLFLLDCNMPIMSGFDLVPVIRSYADHSDTPIIFLTSDGTIDNISVAIQLGARDFMVKPIDDDILREKIAQNVANYQILRRLRAISR